MSAITTTEIVFARPWIQEAEQAAVARVMASGAVAQGPEVAAFEREFASWTGADHAVAVSNGTSALELALAAMGIGATPGEEVIVPAFTFLATAGAVRRVGAVPRFADIDPVSFCLSPATVAAALSERTRAVIPVHLFGYPAPVDTIAAALPAGVQVLEDAAQAHGTQLADRRVGARGTATFSFYPTKNMTTGEGGMVTTGDGDVAERVRLLRNHGMRNQYDYAMVGSNQRMTDMGAAMGRVQLGRLDGFLDRRRQIAATYRDGLAGAGVTLPAVPPPDEGGHAWACFTVRVAARRGDDVLRRDDLQRHLSAHGVQSRVYYPAPLTTLGLFAPGGAACPEADRAATEVLSLPIRPDLSDTEVARVIDVVGDWA